MLQMKFTPDLHPVERRKMVRQLKKIWAVHHMLFISDSEAEIAAAVNISIGKLQQWKQSKEWQHAIAFWTVDTTFQSIQQEKEDVERKAIRKEWRSLACAEKLWIQIIEEGYDLYPKGLEGFIKENTYMRSEDEIPSNQIGLEALLIEETPGPLCSFFQLWGIPHLPKRFWIHNITAALFAIGSLM